jgi:pimeloyl-ACP methyl ester carboxylesterase
VAGVEQWWSEGERVRLALAGVEREIFLRRMGAGSAVTMLHGFPSSSHGWARVAPLLAERHTLLLPDFLGFGASEKPAEHDYTLHEQADLVEALWEREGVNSTAVVAHDYAVSVTQELLSPAGAQEGKRAMRRSCSLLVSALEASPSPVGAGPGGRACRLRGAGVCWLETRPPASAARPSKLYLRQETRCCSHPQAAALAGSTPPGLSACYCKELRQPD